MRTPAGILGVRDLRRDSREVHTDFSPYPWVIYRGCGKASPNLQILLSRPTLALGNSKTDERGDTDPDGRAENPNIAERPEQMPTLQHKKGTLRAVVLRKMLAPSERGMARELFPGRRRVLAALDAAVT